MRISLSKCYRRTVVFPCIARPCSFISFSIILDKLTFFLYSTLCLFHSGVSIDFCPVLCNFMFRFMCVHFFSFSSVDRTTVSSLSVIFPLNLFILSQIFFPLLWSCRMSFVILIYYMFIYSLILVFTIFFNV